MNLGLPALDQLECGHRQKGASDVCGEGRTGKIVLLLLVLVVVFIWCC